MEEEFPNKSQWEETPMIPQREERIFINLPKKTKPSPLMTSPSTLPFQSPSGENIPSPIIIITKVSTSSTSAKKSLPDPIIKIVRSAEKMKEERPRVYKKILNPLDKKDT